MSTEWDITSDDVVAWSDRVDAPHRLPELIRRLLFATAALRALEMRAHGGTRLGGWDGTVLSAAQHPFCPEGLSAWELSVRGDTGKLNEDYEKRLSIPGGAPLAEAHYIAVSARRIDRKRDWEDAKRQDSRWKDVHVIDADDIATWLATAPAVSRWFGAQLGRPAFQMMALDEYLEGWSKRTSPPLPLELLVAGRQRQRDASSILEWAERGGTRVAIEADTSDDALMFAASALAASADADAWRSRTVVVESRDALRWAMHTASAQPLIILPAYADFDAGHALGLARLVIPLDRKSRPNAILLGDIPYNTVAEVLERSGFRALEAQRLAAESGGNLSALQRLCGYHGGARWPSKFDRAELAVLLLLNAWTPGNEADAEAVRKLGCDPIRFERMCEQLATGEHVATVKDHDPWQRASWSWVSEAAAWADLVSDLPSSSLRAFAEVARSILSASDPKFELAASQRFAAGIHGKVLRHSSPLRAGVARAIARLAAADAPLQSRHGPLAGSGLADSIVRRVLAPAWETWASLGHLLSTLAEAAPDAFLACLERSVDAGAAGVIHTFDEEGPFGGPHVGVVAALETLAWNDKVLTRLALVTARLAVADVHASEPGRVVNRPARALTSFFHPLMPATSASQAERFSALRQAARAEPEVGFDAILSLLGTANGGIVIPGHVPEIAAWPRLSHHELWARSATEAASNYSALVDLALEFADGSPSRWNRLLLTANRLDDALEERVLTALGGVLGTLQDYSALIWAALRETLHRDTWREGTPPASAAIRRQLYARCEPQDPVQRVEWIFRLRVSPPDGDPHDWQAAGKRRESEQDLALTSLLQLPNAWSLVHRLASALGTDGWTLGLTLARSNLDATSEAALLSTAAADVFPIEVRASFIAFRVATGASSGWLEAVLRALLEAGRLDDALDISFRLPPNASTWAVLDDVGDQLASMYWTRADRIFPQGLPTETVAFAVDRLRAHGNVASAAEVVFIAKENVDVARTLGVLGELKGEELSRFLKRATGSYMLEELLKRLDAAGADGSALALLELRFLPLFRHGSYRAKYFSAAMASEPKLFVQLVSALYRGDDEGDVASTGESQQRAEAAYLVLDAWRGYPGEGEDETAREETLYSWADAALKGVAEAGRLSTGTIEVAKVLARAPEHSGHWPGVAARRLLEAGAGQELAERMRTAKSNLRGMTSRAVGEGGRLERLLEKRYRESAIALRADWPVTSLMLEQFAQMYAAEAARLDAGARATRRREGLDIPATSDELPPAAQDPEK